MEAKDELRYQRLRALCDKEHYLDTFDYDSIDLIEKLINDLILLKQQIKIFEKNTKQMNNRIDYLILGINAYKTQNIELFKENKDLHYEILNLNNKLSYKGKDMEFCKLKDDKSSLHFLLTDANKKIEKLYHQLNESKKKYIELIENLYKRNIESPKILDELTKEYKVKLDPKIYDFDKYESDIEKDQKILNSATDFNLYNNEVKPTEKTNYNFLEEKCKNLEKELDDKNKEIELLKSKSYANNKEEEKIVIDYLQNKIRDERIKYERYLTFTLNENKKLEKKQKKIEDEKIERRKKYGIQAALQNYRPFSHYNKRRNNNFDNNNKIKTRIKNSNRKGTMNKSNNKIIFENNFLI